MCTCADSNCWIISFQFLFPAKITLTRVNHKVQLQNSHLSSQLFAPPPTPNWFSSKLQSEWGSTDCHLFHTTFTPHCSHSPLFPPTWSQTHSLQVNFTSVLLLLLNWLPWSLLCYMCILSISLNYFSSEDLSLQLVGGWLHATEPKV